MKNFSSKRALSALMIMVMVVGLLMPAASATSTSNYATGYVATGTTLYSSYSTSTSSGTITTGGTVYVVKAVGDFYYIIVGNAEGYVLKTAISNISGTVPSEGIPSKVSVTTGYVAANTSIYASPSLSSNVLATTSNAGTITLEAKNGDFYLIKLSNVTGYIHKSYVSNIAYEGLLETEGSASSTGTSGSGTVTGVVASGAAIYTSASSTSSVLGYVSGSGRINLEAQSGSFYKVTIGTTTGYIAASSVSDIQGSFSGSSSTGTVTGTGTAGYVTNCNSWVTLRKSASSSSSSLAQVPKNAAITIYSTSGSYTYVDYNGTKGYISSTYVAVGSPSGSTGTVSGGNSSTQTGSGTAGYITNCSSWVSLRKTASSSGTRLAQVPKNAVITIYSTSGSYTYVDYNGTKGYISSTYVATGTPPASSGSSSTYTYATGTSADIWGSFSLIEGTNIGTNYSGTKLYDNNIYCNGLNSKGTDYYYNAYSGKKNYFFSLGPQNTEISVIMGHNMRSSLTGMHYLHHIQNAWLGVSKCESCKGSCSTKTSTFYINYGGHSQWQLVGFFELNSKTMSSSSERSKVKNYAVLNYTLTGADKVTWANTLLGYCTSKYYGAAVGSSVSAGDDLMLLVTCGDSGGSSYQTLYMLLKGI